MSSGVPIHTRAQLLEGLALAAELEHLLLCQYLFAAYSLRRTAAEGLDAVGLEWARRWGSKVTLIGRQEMEHLGLVMNMRSAIGGAPFFSRPNFPQKLDYFGSSDLKQELTPFTLATMQRFQFFEQPHPAPGPGYCQAPQALAAEALDQRLREVGVERQGRGYAPTREALEAARRRLSAKKLSTPGSTLDPAPGLTFTSIQDLYLQLLLGFWLTAEELGPEALFCGDPNRQIWGGPGSPYASTMNDLNQYGLDIIQVTDLESASLAILEILFQGEGLLAPKSYIENTHYCLFSSVIEQMQAQPELVVCRPVVNNPLTRMHRDITAPAEVTLITRPETLQVAELANSAYELMLEVLLLLYGVDMDSEQRAALTDVAFFPMMTMFVRPLSEILTQLPAFADGPGGPIPGNAGPGFEMSTDRLELPETKSAAYDDIQFKLDALVVRFKTLSILSMQAQYPTLVPRLKDMGDNMERLATDWRADWTNIGRSSDAKSSDAKSSDANSSDAKSDENGSDEGARS